MIARTCLRLAAVYSLRGRTIAGDRVLDSSLAGLPPLEGGEAVPFVVIYTEGADLEDAGGTLRAGGHVDLVFEAVCPAPAPGLGASDAALELSADVLERQIRVALEDHSSPWARRFSVLAHPVRVTSLRGASQASDDGIAFVARQVTVRAELLAEPRGAEPWFTDFVAALREEEGAEGVSYADAITLAVEGNPAWSDIISTFSPVAHAGIGGPQGDALGLGEGPEMDGEPIITTEPAP